MTLENTPRVRIDYKRRMLSRVKQDGICGLWTNSFQREQLLAQVRGWLPKHPA